MLNALLNFSKKEIQTRLHQSINDEGKWFSSIFQNAEWLESIMSVGLM